VVAVSSADADVRDRAAVEFLATRLRGAREFLGP
jgi:hypothetical protein